MLNISAKFHENRIFILFDKSLPPLCQRTKELTITNYHTIDLNRPWKIASGRADITLATGWYNANDGRLQTTAHACVSDGRTSHGLWLVVAGSAERATTSPICKHRSKFSKVISNIFQIIFAYLFRRVRSYDKEVITRLFSYRHLYQALGRHQPPTSSRAVIDARAWYRCRYENSRVITSN